MKDNTYYEYYAPVREDGTFEISKIRPGSYRLNISLDGIMGEYEYDDIVTVDAGGKVNVGSIQWDNEVNGDTLWTIGIPDRTGEEFAYADSYRCMTSCFRKGLISISVKVKKAKTGFLFRQRPQWLVIFLIMMVDGIMMGEPVWQSMILARQENR